MNLLVAPALFVAYLVLDYVCAKYMKAVEKNQPIRAGSFSASMYFITVFGVLSYTHNAWYALPCALGSFVGTYLSVTEERRKQLAPQPEGVTT